MKKSTRNLAIVGAGVALAFVGGLALQAQAEIQFNKKLTEGLTSFQLATAHESSFLYDSFSYNPLTQVSTIGELQVLVGEPQVIVVDVGELKFKLDGSLDVKDVSAISTYGGVARTIAAADKVHAHYHEDELGDLGATVEGVYVTENLYASYFSEESLVLFNDIFSNKALTVSAKMKEVSKNTFETSLALHTTTGFDFNAHVDYGVIEIEGTKVAPGSPLTKDVMLNKFAFDITDSGFKDILINWGGNLGEPTPDQNAVFQVQLYDALKSLINSSTAPPIPVDALNGLNVFIKDGKGYEFSAKFKNPLRAEFLLEQFIGYPDVSVYDDAEVSFKVVEHEEK